MSKVLVTGAAGFVGKHLVKRLKDEGHDVVAMVRENTDTALLEELGVKIIRADLRNKDSLYNAFEEPVDVVVHLATTMKGPWEEYLESTVNGTRRLLEISKERGVKKFIFISSIAVHDMSKLKPCTVTEDFPLSGETATNYEKSKIQAEAIVKEFMGKGLDCVILRSAVIYGPGGPLFPPRLGFGMGENKYLVIGSGQHTIPLVYIGNLINAIQFALEKDVAGETFNVVDDQDVTQLDYLNAVKERVNPKLKIVKVPYPVMTIFGQSVTFALKLLKRPSPLRRIYLFLCSHTVQYANNKIKEKLGAQPAASSEAIRATMDYFREQRSNPKIVDIKSNCKVITPAEPVNVGMIGCGVIAGTHLDILKSIKNAHVVGLCDNNLEAAQELSKQYGNIPYYASVGEMLNAQKIDVVHIMTPPQTRVEIVRKAAEKGCDILLEKPMAMNAADAEEILKITKDNNVKLCLMHNHVYDPPMIEARKLVSTGALGDILHVESWYGFNLNANLSCRYMVPGAEKHWTMGLPGKLYQNLISHPISVLTDVFGMPEKIHAVAESAKVVKTMKTDELRVLVSGNGKTGLLSVALAVNPRYQFLNIYGSEMSIFVDFLNKTIIKHATPKGVPKAISRALFTMSSGRTMIGSTLRNILKVLTGKFTYFDGTEILMKEFYKRLKTDLPMPVTGEDGLMSMKIMDEIWGQITL